MGLLSKRLVLKWHAHAHAPLSETGKKVANPNPSPSPNPSREVHRGVTAHAMRVGADELSKARLTRVSSRAVALERLVFPTA